MRSQASTITWTYIFVWKFEWYVFQIIETPIKPVNKEVCFDLKLSYWAELPSEIRLGSLQKYFCSWAGSIQGSPAYLPDALPLSYQSLILQSVKKTSNKLWCWPAGDRGGNWLLQKTCAVDRCDHTVDFLLHGLGFVPFDLDRTALDLPPILNPIFWLWLLPGC